MKKINIDAPSRNYDVYIGGSVFTKYSSKINSLAENNDSIIIVDSKVYELHKGKIEHLLHGVNGNSIVYKFKADEKNKSFESMKKIFDLMLRKKMGRNTLLIAIGGGITGDLSGFAASVYARGIRYIHIPTTLLAMVDSAIGGKTGINYGHTKNIIGTFYQPESVFIETDFIKTLPREEILCGLGEVIKYGLLIGDDFFNYVARNYHRAFDYNGAFLNKVICESVLFKGSTVENDEKEKSGLRKILNLGHTFAHAIEVEQDHKIKHGMAVIAGIGCALHLSNKIGLMNDEYLENYLSLIIKFRDEIKLKKYNSEAIYNIMFRDKKNKKGTINFVLIEKAGKLVIDAEADKADVLYSIKNGLQYFEA
ncbi:3-dehydroquinate synthase [Melioribacter sp. OK-6-Me]|uniref:3-dehydroquinate synthase n=1 Tax=unclassified Melioribacter TaxID=2627329 RepID=UPI003EDA3E29